MNCLLITTDGRIASSLDVASADDCTAAASAPDAPASSYSLLLSTPSDGVGGVDSLPPPDQLATAWGVGFVMVVGCYVIARSVGVVVNFLK